MNHNKMCISYAYPMDVAHCPGPTTRRLHKGNPKDTQRECHINRNVLNSLKFKFKKTNTMDINEIFLDDSVINRRVSEI